MAEATRENALKAMRAAYERGDMESALRMAAYAKKLTPLPETKPTPQADPEGQVETFTAPIKQAAKAPNDLPPDVPSQAELDEYHSKQKNEFEQFFANMGKQAIELLGYREDAKQATRAVAQNLGAAGAAGAEAVGRMAAAPVSGESFKDIADNMQANVEAWGYAPEREGAKKVLEGAQKVFEPIDSATFRAGTIFEDVPVIGPTLATATKVGLDTAIGALSARLVGKGMSATTAKMKARAQIKAERAAKAERQAAANHYFQKDHAFKNNKPAPVDGDLVDTTGVLASKEAFVKEYIKNNKGSVTMSEIDNKWQEYMKQSFKEEDIWTEGKLSALNKPRPRPADVEPIELPPPVLAKRKSKLGDGVGEFLGSVVSRLDAIDPTKTLSSAIRVMEHNIEKKMVFRNAVLDDFYRISDRMYAGKFRDNWHTAYMKQDWNELKNLAISAQVKPHKLRAFDGDYDRIFNTVRDTLNEMGNEALDSGFRGFALINDYLPRHITEDKLAGLVNLEPDLAARFGPQKIAKITKAMNKTYDDYSTRMEAINGALTSGGSSRIPAITAQQAKRRGEVLPLEYYEPGHVAIKRYINDMTESIEMRKFLGRNKASMDESLAAFVDTQGELMNLGQREVNVLKGVLEARFKEGRMHTPKFWQTVKNFGYLTSIGNVWSTITQVGDIFASMRTLGFRNTVGGIKDIATRKGIQTAEVGYEQIMKELADTSKSSKLLDRALIVSGFKAMDQFGKKTIVNASRRKYRKLASTTKGRERIAEDYGWLAKKSPEEYSQFLDDLAKGDISNDNVKLAIFNDLADLQPITLSDMPLSYLRNPRGRVLWALKTWQSQQLNTLYRHTVQEFKRGNKARAASNMMKFITYNVILGTAGVDTFKEWLAKAFAGEDITAEDVTDNISEALMRTAFISRYAIDKSQGPVDFWYHASSVAAPSLQGTLNRGYRALQKEGMEEKGKELFKLLPIIGAPYGAYERAKEDK